MTTLQKQKRIFDMDGTLYALADDPTQVTLDPDALVFLQQDQPENNAFLTGRDLDAAKTMLGEELSGKYPIICSHGLVCHMPDGQIHHHPSVAEILPDIDAIHAAIVEMEKMFGAEGVFFERKFAGATVNTNKIANETRRREILAVATEKFQPFVKENISHLAREPGPNGQLTAVEFRSVYGKKDGFTYFLEQGLLGDPDAHFTFHCDSLDTHGTDRSVADMLTENGHDVVQVKNNPDKPRYPDARLVFETPADLGRHLKNSLN